MSRPNKPWDDLTRLMEDAADAARGLGREAGNLFQSQIDAFLREKDMVPREQFDALAERALAMRERIEELEKRLDRAEAAIAEYDREKRRAAKQRAAEQRAAERIAEGEDPESSKNH